MDVSRHTLYFLYRTTLQDPVASHRREYHACSNSIHAGAGPAMPSTLCEEMKKQLFNPNTASPRSRSISALMAKRPSESRGPGLRGESPHRTTISLGVLLTTSKWSVSWVPGSNVESESWPTVHN